MTLDIHERTRTPHPFEEVVMILAEAYAGLVGELPPAPLLATAAAIIGVENAAGIAIFDENFGNLSASDGPVSPNPFHKDGEQTPAFFSWFPNAETGARAWWRLMMRRYRPVLLAGLEGDPELAARELYRLGYVVALRTGEMHDYERGARAFYRKAWPTAEAIGLTGADRPAWEGTAAAVASVLVVGAALVASRAAA